MLGLVSQLVREMRLACSALNAALLNKTIALKRKQVCTTALSVSSSSSANSLTVFVVPLNKVTRRPRVLPKNRLSNLVRSRSYLRTKKEKMGHLLEVV